MIDENELLIDIVNCRVDDLIEPSDLQKYIVALSEIIAKAILRKIEIQNTIASDSKRKNLYLVIK